MNTNMDFIRKIEYTIFKIAEEHSVYFWEARKENKGIRGSYENEGRTVWMVNWDLAEAWARG